MDLAVHLWAQVEFPYIVAPPISARFVSQEGAHDFMEIIWRRGREGGLPGYDELDLKDPIAVHYGRRSQPAGMDQEQWFYGYVESMQTTDRSISVTALGVTERMKQASPRYHSDNWLSTILDSVVKPYRLRSAVQGQDIYVQGLYQNDTDWAFLKGLADLYAYSLVVDTGTVTFRKRDSFVFGDPPLYVARNMATLDYGVRRGFWVMPPARMLSADAMVGYCMGNVDPRTGVPYVERQTVPNGLNRDRYVEHHGSNSLSDTRMTLSGVVMQHEFGNDIATAIAQEGLPRVKAGMVIYSQVDKADLDGLWWVSRIEHKFDANLSQSTLDLCRPLQSKVDQRTFRDLQALMLVPPYGSEAPSAVQGEWAYA